MSTVLGCTYLIFQTHLKGYHRCIASCESLEARDAVLRLYSLQEAFWVVEHGAPVGGLRTRQWREPKDTGLPPV